MINRLLTVLHKPSRPYLYRWTWVLCGVALLSLGSGCSKENTLTDEQKNQIRESLDSSGRAYNAAQRNGTVSSDPQAPEFRNMDSFVDEMTNVIRLRVKEKKCRITPEPRTRLSGRNNSSGSARVFTGLRVVGNSSCPISLDFKISAQAESSVDRRVTFFDYFYSVADDSYRRLNDVHWIKLNGHMTLSGLSNDRSRGEINLDGNIHSRQYGDIKVSVRGKMEGAPSQFDGETVWRFEFRDFVVDFRQLFERGSIKHYVNDEEVSRDEFNGYFDRGGAPFSHGINLSNFH